MIEQNMNVLAFAFDKSQITFMTKIKLDTLSTLKECSMILVKVFLELLGSFKVFITICTSKFFNSYISDRWIFAHELQKKTNSVINILYYQCLKNVNVLAFVFDKGQFTFMTKIKLELIINLIYDFFKKNLSYCLNSSSAST